MTDRTELNDRTRRTTERLMEHFLEASVVPRPMTEFEWGTASLSDPSNLHRPYGWIPPFAVNGPHPDACACSACCAGEEAETVLALFCPALIATQTAHLDDDAFEKYLNVIDFCTSLHIIHRDLAWAEREQIVDNQLYDTAPDSMALLNETQMSILDRMQGDSPDAEGQNG